MRAVRIAAAQTAEYRDDVEGALSSAVELSQQAKAEGASLLCFPEGYLQGYLTDEASARRVALDVSSSHFNDLMKRFSKVGPTIVMGFIEVSMGKLFNSAVVIEGATTVGCYRKRHLLPGESAFSAGADTPVFNAGGLKFGINICYDTNFPAAAQRVADCGATLIVCPANNMMRRDRAEIFRDAHNSVRGDRCRETGLWLVSADVSGERDGRVSLGPTAVLNPEGDVVKQLPLGKPGLLLVDIPVRA
ncbi:carbon-nitrogen hydrolase family protein [Agrobacterium tumefaciens]|uniref:carbon-nitrogen hydrolase family protein n=1 Tax=Agrobacterium TaxID=357 RepID=UPI00115DC834|nr:MULTISPECIES: carbon-nitrogen hydrolase family protein [Agrobacterium]MDA5245334.1 carbon-nitrogen hydrolase family protein [Agrobacterium sp. MAFF310724]MDA5246237.1 carbon-nitrogen hydrolase family protein [Agrobacterium sp. MAFF210268]TRB17645.1 carbon-nitrogen hydrolase family protein [Agrobacterium tumefaciens]